MTDDIVYVCKVVENQLPGLYYLISWNSYLRAKNTQELNSAMMNPCNMIHTFHKNYSKKSIARFLSINFALSLAKS